MKKRDEKDMNYESNITIIRREYNEERVSENLRARIEFFKKNKRAPKRSKDKEEQRLYDSYRRLNLEDYYNLDKYLLEENKMIDAYDLAHKDFYKRQKSINSKRNYISKVIKNYYNFYLENNRFASDVDKGNKLERKISKDYNGIICYKKYYTKEHLYYINMINEIKKNKRNRENLQKIKKYINFCLENSKVPVHFSSDSKNVERKKENRIAINLEKLNLDDIVIPNALLNELYDAIGSVKNKDEDDYKLALNELFLNIIRYMEENNCSCFNDKNLKFPYNDKEISSDHAMCLIRENSKYLDGDLIEKYNGFPFVRKKLNM